MELAVSGLALAMCGAGVLLASWIAKEQEAMWKALQRQAELTEELAQQSAKALAYLEGRLTRLEE